MNQISFFIRARVLLLVVGLSLIITSTSANATTYYVSPTGNDSAAGISPSSPWKTIAKLQNSTFNAGDSVFLQGGATFTGCLKFLPSRIQSTRANPFTLGSYGGGRFTLKSNCGGAQTAAIQLVSLNGFILQDAIILGDGTSPYGVWIYNYTSTQTGGVVIQRSDISGFYSTGKGYGGEIFLTTATAAIGAMTDIKILSNTLHGLNGPTSADDNGISGVSHGNITNLVVRGNTVFNMGGHPNGNMGTVGNGILVNGVKGALVEGNIVHDGGGNTNTCGGPGGIWAVGSDNVVIQRNEVYNMRPVNKTTGCDWAGFDLDMAVTNSTVQYNYSHNNYGPGYLAYGTSSVWKNNTFRYNISENDGAGLALNLDPGQPFSAYNNTFYVGGPSSLIAQPTAFLISTHTPNAGLIANNIFMATGNAYLMKTNGLNPSGLVILHNDYHASSVARIEWRGVAYSSVAAWAAAPGTDDEALNLNPIFKSAGTGGICLRSTPGCALGYELALNSPLIGAGLNLKGSVYAVSVGSQDYFGHATPHSKGTGFNLGADGSRSADVIVISLTQQKYGADNALAQITIDGIVYAAKIAVSELWGSKTPNVFTYYVAPGASHSVNVKLLNDASAPGQDRNLFVVGLAANGKSQTGVPAAIYTNALSKTLAVVP